MFSCLLLGKCSVADIIQIVIVIRGVVFLMFLYFVLGSRGAISYITT